MARGVIGAVGVLLALVAAAVALAADPSESGGDGRAERAYDTKCGQFPFPVTAQIGLPSLPDQTAWNQDISLSPVAPDSAAIINALPGDNLHPDFGSPRAYGIPYKVVGKQTKPVKVKFTAYGSESDKGKYRIPLSTPVEGGANADGDRHVIAYDKARCKLYELYRAFPKKSQGRWDAEGGVIWDLRSAGLRKEGWTSADAAGLPIYPGLVRYDEVQSGRIDHAIRLTFASTRDAWINPGSHCAGDTSSATAPPMGLRMRLKASFDTSAITGDAAVIAEALKHYGFFVADNGSDWYFSGATDKRWDDNNLNQLKEIPGSAFEVVQSAAPLVTC